MNEVLQYILIILFVAVVAFVIPYLKDNIDKVKLEKIIQVVKIFVEAAEQILKDSSGADKKKFVLAQLSGLKIDEEFLDTIIESEVLKLKK